ncbi:hypothetical protein GFD21_06540 [Bifidobacterium sp. SMA15]|uniref:DUF4373 domain-containing protein n=2 Tax=Bifidobacterium platyrrhinorum TaxID=2661628 RepID=A0A6L9SSE8_9BIFI|nr:hypothetical protein [Bifidobacterium platyrrhinorum]
MEIFAKFSADLWSNEKFCAFAEKHARAAIVWVKAITFAVRKRSDGFFGDYAAKHFLSASARDLDALEANGFIERVENGWMVHDFLEAQRSNQQIEAAAERRREAARKAGLASAAARNSQSGTSTNVERTVGRDVERSLNGSLDSKTNVSSTLTNPDNRLQITDTNTPCSPPTGDADGLDEFARTCWTRYPKHEGKPTVAMNAVKELVSSGEITQERLLAAIDAYAATDKKLQYRPQFVNWLRKGEWRDYLPKTAPKQTALPEDGWVDRHVVCKLPDGADIMGAQQRLRELIRSGDSWDAAAGKVLTEFGGES